MTTRAKLKVESVKRISPNPGEPPVYVATLSEVLSRDLDPATGKRIALVMPWALLTVIVTDPAIAQTMQKGHCFQMELTEMLPAAA